MVTLETPYKECGNAARIYKMVCQGKKPRALDRIANQAVKEFISWCLEDNEKRPGARQLLEC